MKVMSQLAIDDNVNNIKLSQHHTICCLKYYKTQRN